MRKVDQLMQSEYTLLKCVNGITHYACVSIEATTLKDEIQIIDDINEPIVESDGEVNRKTASSWIEAALLGARLSAETLVQRDHLSGCCIVVKRVVGALIDTTESDVTCAATLATWQALNPNFSLPSFEFVNGEWHFIF